MNVKGCVSIATNRCLYRCTGCQHSLNQLKLCHGYCIKRGRRSTDSASAFLSVFYSHTFSNVFSSRGFSISSTRMSPGRMTQGSTTSRDPVTQVDRQISFDNRQLHGSVSRRQRSIKAFLLISGTFLTSSAIITIREVWYRGDLCLLSTIFQSIVSLRMKTEL